MLYNILRNRLAPRYNKKEFTKWLFENKNDKTNENHHILKSYIGGKKQNGYLQAEISPTFHKVITYNREPTEDEFIDMLIDSLENLFNYVEYLEEKKNV